MIRLYNPYTTWEDLKSNFYGGVSTFKKEGVLERCASLLKNQTRFAAALDTIINSWKHSCEHNLTNEGMNRVAYLGQAACALVHNVPHNVSMSAYNLLSTEEQATANSIAQAYLDTWIARHEGSQT